MYLGVLNRTELKEGDKVIFDDKVYYLPFAPYYDEYKGHVFEIVKFYCQKTHIELKCLTGNIVVSYVHPDELIKV